MFKKVVSGIMLAVLLISVSALTLSIQPVKASETIYMYVFFVFGI